jgi:hypothetical protein
MRNRQIEFKSNPFVYLGKGVFYFFGAESLVLLRCLLPLSATIPVGPNTGPTGIFATIGAREGDLVLL